MPQLFCNTRSARATQLTLALALCALTPLTARAEGSAQIGENQGLVAQTLFLDIVNSSVETIRWRGIGTLRVEDPAGNLVTHAAPAGAAARRVPASPRCPPTPTARTA
jgi:hypothetical protein